MFYFKQTIHVSASVVSQYSANQESGMGGALAEQSCSPKSARFLFALFKTSTISPEQIPVLLD